jgi:hypothetical protein
VGDGRANSPRALEDARCVPALFKEGHKSSFLILRRIDDAQLARLEEKSFPHVL